MAWDDTNAGDGVVTENEWNAMVEYVKNRNHLGSFVVTSTGTQSITGVGFQPTQIQFSGEAVGGSNVDSSGTGGSSVGNYAGSFTGIARDDGTRRVIHSGGSGNSINETSHYSSNSECIAIRYAGQSGGLLGFLRGDVTSFDSDGFTINVTDYQQNEVVLYNAIR